jgi:hypothetical protein
MNRDKFARMPSPEAPLKCPTSQKLPSNPADFYATFIASLRHRHLLHPAQILIPSTRCQARSSGPCMGALLRPMSAKIDPTRPTSLFLIDLSAHRCTMDSDAQLIRLLLRLNLLSRNASRNSIHDLRDRFISPSACPFPKPHATTTRTKHIAAHSLQKKGFWRYSGHETRATKATSRGSAPPRDLSRPTSPPEPGSTSLSSAHGHAHW